MKFILGKKLNMTQDYDTTGNVVPLTVVQAGPCTITQVKTAKVDGYNALQVGYGVRKFLTKALRGHLKGLAQFKYLKEFPLTKESNFTRGQEIDSTTFVVGERVSVQGISKGKGFQGVVKRHGFHGSPASHGHKDQLRMPGSIGAGGVQKVFKGMRMAGHMGNEQVTVKNLEIFKIDSEKNLIYLIGAVPGIKGALLVISAEGELKLAAPVVAEKVATEQSVSVENSAQPEPVETPVVADEVNNNSQTE